MAKKLGIIEKKALIKIGIGVLLLGTGPMFVKAVRANGTMVAAYRLMFAAAMLTIPALVSQGKNKNDIERDNPLLWAIFGGISFAINIALWCTALNHTTATIVTLLDNTAPVWVGLFTLLVLKKKQERSYWWGLGLTILGSILLVGSSRASFNNQKFVGNIIGIASGVSYAAYILITQQARRTIPGLKYSWLVSTIGALFLFIFGLLRGVFQEVLSPQDLVLIFLMALTSQVVGWYLVNDALGKLPAPIVSVTLVGQPVVVTILGVFILPEIPTAIQAVGGIICLLGIFVVQKSF
jgi:drug/metabolite transporter (DMT)-like permease